MKWLSRAGRRNGAGGGGANLPADHIVEIPTRHGLVPVELRANDRARRYSLRQSASQARIILTIPKGGNAEAAVEFARTQAGWLARQQQHSAPARPFLEGGHFPYQGDEHVLARRPGLRGPVKLAHQAGTELPVIIVTAPPEHLARRLSDWLKKQARAQLAASVARHAAVLEVKPGRISVRDQSSRWGSCSSQGNLSFSWRLVLAPPEVLDYVAAHEVAHLIEMNHSASFWKIVETLRPDMKTQRRWLRKNSAALHAIGRDENTGS